MYFDDGDDEEQGEEEVRPLTEEEQRQQKLQWKAYERQLDEDSRSLSLVRDEHKLQTWDEEEQQEAEEARFKGEGGGGGGGGRKRGAAPLPTCHYFGCKQTYRNAPSTCPNPRNTTDKFRTQFPDLPYSFCSVQCVVNFAHYEIAPDASEPVLAILRVRHPGLSIEATRSPLETLQKEFAGVTLDDKEKTRAVGTSERVRWIAKRDKTVVAINED